MSEVEPEYGPIEVQMPSEPPTERALLARVVQQNDQIIQLLRQIIATVGS